MKPFYLALLTSIAVLSAHGQRLVRHFQPVAAMQPSISSCETDVNGNIYVTGSFNFVNNKLSGGLIKMKPDGSLDDNFSVQPAARGSKAYPTKDGKVFLIGEYRLPDGSITSLVRLNADGTRDATFVSAIIASVDDLVVQSTGKVVVTGTFQSAPDYPYLARLNVDGSLDQTFTKHSFLVTKFGKGIGIDKDDNLYVSDNTKILKLDPNGAEDITYAGIGSDPQFRIYGVTVLASAKAIVHGTFTKFNGVNAKGIVRLNVNGTVDETFSFGGDINIIQGDIITELSNGNIVVAAGCCNGYLELGPTGALVRSIAQGNGILTMADSNGGLIVAGQFSSIMGSTATPHVARIKSSGELDTAFIAPMMYSVGEPSMLIDAQDRVVVGATETPLGLMNNGIFTSGAVARLTPLGDVDNTFASTLSDNANIWSGYVQGDGKYVLSGLFPGSVPTKILLRLNSDGTMDNSFVAGTTPLSMGRITKFSGNNIYMTGQWGQYNGITTGGFIRLNADGSIAQTYTAWQQTGVARTFEVQQDGRVWFSGLTPTFTEVLRRFNTDGTPDDTFPSLDFVMGSGRAMAVDANGFVYIGGSFASIGSIASPKLAKLKPDGTQASGFSTGTGFAPASSSIWALQILPSGNIAVAGSFTEYNGVAANGFVIIDPNGAIVPSPNVAFGPGTSISKLTWANDALYVSGRLWNTDLTQLSSMRKISFASDAMPAAPGNVKVDLPEEGVFNISWADNSSTEIAFIVERSLSSTGDFTAVKSLSANTTSMKDSLIAPNVTYYYRVTASGNGGESTSDVASLKWIPVPPAIPEQLAAVQQAIDQIKVSWVDKSTIETSFRLERSSDNGTTFSKVMTIPRNVTQYIDAPEPTKGDYTYRIKSVGKYLSSAYTPNTAISIITGIEDHLPLTIYPNPARHEIIVEAGDPGTIHLMSLAGVLVSSLPSSEGKTIVDLHGIDAGMYILKFMTGCGVITKKISVLP